MLRIGYLVSRYPAISHTFILREVQELRRLGIDIRTISINPPDRSMADLSPDEHAEAGQTFVVKSQSAGTILRALLRTALAHPLGLLAGVVLAIRLSGWNLHALVKRTFYLLEAIVAGEWMRQQSLAHLHVHFATPAATVALFLKRIFGTPFSLTVHGPDEFYEVSEYHLEQKIDAASFICCIGRYCRSQLMKLSRPDHWDKFEISPLGVDGARFMGSPKARRTGKTLFRILCVGRLVPAKGQAVLLAALRLLRERGRDVEVVFAGDGPDRARLQSLAREWDVEQSCQFLGAVNPDSVTGLYANADLFVLPSFAEGIPVVLMEAMAMGVPCVSTFVNGIPELIESGRQGFLVPPSDPTALCEVVAQLMDDEHAMEACASEARSKVMNHYDLQTNVRKLSEIFRARLEPAA